MMLMSIILEVNTKNQNLLLGFRSFYSRTGSDSGARKSAGSLNWY